MADGEEEAVDLDVEVVFLRCALLAHDVSALHAVLAEEAHGVAFKEDLDVLLVSHPLLHNVGGAEIVLADNEIYLVGESGEVEGLLACGVAATHYSHVFLSIEEAVASGACAHAEASVFLLVGETEISCRRSG